MKQALLYLILLACMERTTAQVAQIPKIKHKFTVVAHRGDHVDVPENTLAAFKKGIKHHVDYVEIDLRTTKDSMLVVMHDNTVDRMTDGKGKVSDLTYAEIRHLQIRDRRIGQDSTKTYPVPTFEEVLKTCKNKIHIYLDFKDASVQQAYDMIKQHSMEKQVIVYINTPFQYKEWRRLVPDMPLMLSLPNNIKTEDDLNNFLAKTPLALLDGNYSGYTPGMVQVAVKAGITTWPDIQSPGEAANWDKAIATGFTGLQTDHPEALIRYLKKKGLR